MKTWNIIVSIYCILLLVFTIAMLIFSISVITEQPERSGSIFEPFNLISESIGNLFEGMMVLLVFFVLNTFLSGLGLVVHAIMMLANKDFTTHPKVNLGLLLFHLLWPFILYGFISIASWIS